MPPADAVRLTVSEKFVRRYSKHPTSRRKAWGRWQGSCFIAQRTVPCGKIIRRSGKRC